MTEKFEKFSNALDELIKEGENLFMAIQYDCHPEELREELLKTLDNKSVDAYLEKLPNFREKYQEWYSQAHSLIKQVLPDRLDDFESYYEFTKTRKAITFQNYMIKDYLQGLRITKGWEKTVVADGSAAIPEFNQQLNMVKAARKSLESRLIELTSILQADLFDSEIDSARALGKAGYLRAAGAICGVVIEKHLLHVCSVHSIAIRKKNPGINDLNQALRDNDIISVPQWRFIQHLADIRNLCDHAKTKDPSKEEIEDLLSGTEKILKTVF